MIEVQATADDEETPLYMMATLDENGEATAEPLFAAVRCTAKAVTLLRALTQFCYEHQVLCLTLMNVDFVFWDILPGSKLESVMEESTSWHLAGCTHSAQLHGRLKLPNGAYGEVQSLARSIPIDLSELENLREHEIAIDYADHEEHEKVIGMPFALAVFKRMAELEKWTRTEEPPD